MSPLVVSIRQRKCPENPRDGTLPAHSTKGETGMRTWMRTLSPGLCLVLGTVACDGLGTEPTAIDDGIVLAEAALVAADGMYQDLDLVQDPGLEDVGFDGVGTGMLLAVEGESQCQRMGSGGTFTCAPMTRDGFTFDREVTYYDANEEVQDAFEKTTTDGIHLVINGEGTRERNFWTVTMERDRDMWMTELLSAEHHLNGEGSSAIHRSGNPGDGSARTFDMTVSVVWDDVVHVQPRAENPYPLSGTITREIFVEVTVDGEVVGGRDVTTVVTFDGNQFVTMLVDGEPVEIDLAEEGVNKRFGNFGGNGGGMGGGHG